MKTSASVLNSRFWQLLTVVSQLLELSLCWSACALTVVAAPAAGAALLSVLSGLRAGEGGGVVRRFFTELRRCWRRATLCGLGAAAVTAVWVVDVTVCVQNFTAGYGWAALTGLLLGGGAVGWGTLIFLLLLLTRREEPLRVLVRRAAALALGRLPRTLVMVLAGCAGAWVMGRLWWIAFLFPAFFALPMATAADGALRPAGERAHSGETEEQA